MKKLSFIPLVLVGTYCFADSTFIGNAVTMGMATASTVTVTQLGTGNVQSVGGILVNAAATVSAGSTNYIQNTNTLQSGSTFYVSSGTVRGLFTVEQSDDDTGSGPISLKTLMTQEGASNMYHSLFLYGLVSDPASNGGEFVLTVSSRPLTTSIGAIADRLQRPEIAMIGGDFAGGAGSNSQYIALRASGKQFPNGSPYGDFVILVGTITAYNPLLLNYAGTGPLQTDSNKIVRSWAISLSSQVIGTLPLTNLVSSVTVAGILTAGTGVTITPGSGITTIVATGDGKGYSVEPGTVTFQLSKGVTWSTGTATSTTTLNSISYSTGSSVIQISTTSGVTVGTCGSGPAIRGGNFVGEVTTGTGVGLSQCVISFTTPSPFANAPMCFIQNKTLTVALTYTSTTADLTISGVGIASDTFNYQCYDVRSSQ